jgi:folate-binding Fe-S cluster repair protein YgfZ
LISNDINKVSETNTCFASLLSPQGKFLYEFVIIKHKSGYLIDCEKSQVDGLFKQLSIYKLRSKVEILNLSNEFVVAAFSYEKFLNFDEAQDIAGFTLKYREDPILLDPRNKQLGARLIINLEKLYLSLKKLELHDSNIKDYYSFSHKLGIVPKDFNKLQNKLFGIECNYTTRIKLKNKLSKRLFPINIIKGELIEGESIYFNENEIGKVLIEKDYPFALIKYLDENFNGKSNFNTKNASINIKKPDWIKS